MEEQLKRIADCLERLEQIIVITSLSRNEYTLNKDRKADTIAENCLEADNELLENYLK